MALRNTEPYLSFGGKIDPLTEIRNVGIVTSGQVFWVKSTADSAYTTLKNDVGNSVLKDTLADAISAVVADRDDYILWAPTDSGTITPITSAVNVNKNRTHVISLGALGNPVGYSNTIRGYGTTVAHGTSLLEVNAAGVEVAGFRVLGTTGTSDNGTVTMNVRLGTASTGTAHAAYLHDMVIEGSQTTALGGTAPMLVIQGAVGAGIQGVRVERSWLGNWQWAPTPIVSCQGTAGPTRVTLKDCTLVMDAQATSDRFVDFGTGVIQYMLAENCKFLNIESGTLPASAFSGVPGGDQAVILHQNAFVNVTQSGSGAGVYKTGATSGTAAAIVDSQIGIGSAAVIPS